MTSLKRSLAADGQGSNVVNKVFVRSGKNGRVQKIVREIYLRQDIPCSSKLCAQCLANAPTDTNSVVLPFVLSDRPASVKAFEHGHYLVPDTNALLNGLDLFEQTTVFYDVIILQTVLEELRHRSLPLYNRLMALTRSDEKRFYVFFNDFRLETHVRRESGETINDRNDRAVRRAVQWYGQHLEQSMTSKGRGRACPAIVMLSNDKANLQKAQTMGLHALSLEDYISGLDDAHRLLDMISSSTGQDVITRATTIFYPEYFSQSKMMTGVKAGTLHEGVFNVSPYNFLEGSLNTSAFERPLLIVGRENINRAIQGDVVVVEVLPKSQWKAPSSKIIEEETVNRDDNPDEEEGESITTDRERRLLQEEVRKVHGQSREGRAQPTARVVGVIKRNWRPYVGHIDSGSVSQSAKQSRRQQTVFFLPMDKRLPKIRLVTRQAGELLGQRVVVTIDGWDRQSRYPVGHFVRSLGELESKAAETEALLLEYDVQYRPFPTAVLDCLPKEGHDWKVPANESDPGWADRSDLRHLLVCSIDPVGCQDIDDALHARALPNGNHEVGVHIADVSHFVKPDSAMDAEAAARATTVYLVDKRIDMLPMLLGTDLCSLRPYVERYAFSVIWEIQKDAEVVGVHFTKSVIRSREAFSYEQAQLRIDDVAQQDPLTKGMRTLLSLSKRLRQKRMDAGALNLASPEVRIQAESETSDPIDVETKRMLDTNSLVEEFMLLANIHVAKKIYECFPRTALLRRHPTPHSTSFDHLTAMLKVRKGLGLDVISSKSLADSLDRCIDPNEPFFNTLVRILATRCMTSAEYFAAGSHRGGGQETTEPAGEFRHYGLATEMYTHFTSPIRRYADLMVHRQLYFAISSSSSSSTVVGGDIIRLRPLEGLCINLNRRHRNAQLAGRASVEYFVGQAIKSGRLSMVTDDDDDDHHHHLGRRRRHHPYEQDGFVIRVFVNGIVVYVPRFGIEGLIRLDDIRRSLREMSSTGTTRRNYHLDEEIVADADTDDHEDGDAKEFDPDEFVLDVTEVMMGQSSRRRRRVRLEMFGKVRVCVRDEKDEGTGKRKVKLELAL